MSKQAPNHELRYTVCNTIFIFKCLLAIGFGCYGLGFNGWLVYKMYSTALRPLPPVSFPPLTSPDASRCYHTTSKARLEPPDGSFFWGFSPEWKTDGRMPSDIVATLGNLPAIYNTFINMTLTDFKQDIIRWNCQKVGELGGILELTLQPNMKVTEIPDQMYLDIAIFLRRMNADYGVPILLRFMHEMNGNWMPYGMQPTAQIAAWRKLSAAVRRQTNMTALLWSPNIGHGYPYRGAGYDFNIPTRSSPDFVALDTNRDGVLNENDDPYGPYYPGPDVIDWVGISLYNFNRDNGQTSPVVPGAFSDPNSQYTLEDPQYPFYTLYVKNTGKPFIFSETGSAVDYNFPGQRAVVTTPPSVAQETITKQSWWKEILNQSLGANGSFPALKGAVWFEEMKTESAYQDATANVLRDYRITANATVRSAFYKDLTSTGQVTSPGKFSFLCNGDFRFTN